MRSSLVKLACHGVRTARRPIVRRFWAHFILLSWMILPAFAQQKHDRLLVFGDDFMFSVKEPPGWNGDTTNAEKFQSNVVLHETGQPADSFSGLIRIRVNTKVDENTSTDLQEDMHQYRAQYPKVQFKDLSVKHPQYTCLSKVFYVPGQFYEYVAYVNPGLKKPLVFFSGHEQSKVRGQCKGARGV